GAAGFGVYWLLRLILNLHKQTNNVLPTLMTAAADNMVQALKLVEKESACRVLATDTLSNRINSLDTRFQSDLDREVGALHAKLDELNGKEARARTDGINAISHRLDLDFERMNKLETSLPNLTFGRIQEIEKKLTTQINALNKRVDKVESPPSLNMDTFKGLGLANSIPRVQTPTEAALETFIESLSSNSNATTTRPDGLRCCHGNEILSTHECGRP